MGFRLRGTGREKQHERVDATGAVDGEGVAAEWREARDDGGCVLLRDGRELSLPEGLDEWHDATCLDDGLFG